MIITKKVVEAARAVIAARDIQEELENALDLLDDALSLLDDETETEPPEDELQDEDFDDEETD